MPNDVRIDEAGRPSPRHHDTGDRPDDADQRPSHPGRGVGGDPSGRTGRGLGPGRSRGPVRGPPRRPHPGRGGIPAPTPGRILAHPAGRPPRAGSTWPAIGSTASAPGRPESRSGSATIGSPSTPTRAMRRASAGRAPTMRRSPSWPRGSTASRSSSLPSPGPSLSLRHLAPARARPGRGLRPGPGVGARPSDALAGPPRTARALAPGPAGGAAMGVAMEGRRGEPPSRAAPCRPARPTRPRRGVRPRLRPRRLAHPRAFSDQAGRCQGPGEIGPKGAGRSAEPGGCPQAFGRVEPDPGPARSRGSAAPDRPGRMADRGGCRPPAVGSDPYPNPNSGPIEFSTALPSDAGIALGDWPIEIPASAAAPEPLADSDPATVADPSGMDEVEGAIPASPLHERLRTGRHRRSPGRPTRIDSPPRTPTPRSSTSSQSPRRRRRSRWSWWIERPRAGRRSRWSTSRSRPA
jgi:hypothetical protein